MRHLRKANKEMTSPGTPIAKYPRVTEHQLVMADAYSKETLAPIMAIAFIQSVQADKLEPVWIKHRVLNYVNQLVYDDQFKARKKKKNRTVNSFKASGFFLLDDLIIALKANEERVADFKEEARLKRLAKKEAEKVAEHDKNTRADKAKE